MRPGRGVTSLLDTIGTPQKGKVRYGADTTPDVFVALVESRPFLRECIRRSMQSAFSVPVVTFSTLPEVSGHGLSASPALVVLSLIEASREAWASALKDLSESDDRHRRVVTLASTNDAELARSAIQHGAKGYVPVTMGFEIAMKPFEFVLVGGTMRRRTIFSRRNRSTSRRRRIPNRSALSPAAKTRWSPQSSRASRTRSSHTT